MLTFFDAYCGLGQLSHPIFGQEFATADQLSAVMAHANIGEALVYNPAAYEYDPVTGNTLLMEAIVGYPNLHPCWVLLPPATGEMPPPTQLLDQMRRQGVQAARLCPSPARNNYSLSEWCSGPLLASMADAHVPLFLDQNEASWGEIAALLARYPALPVVLTGVTYRVDRYLYPLWEQHNNLFVEISGYQGLLGVEAVVNRFGPERLLFGTNLPTFNPGAAVTTVMYAGIRDEDKSLIAAGNLRRLLESAYGH